MSVVTTVGGEKTTLLPSVVDPPKDLPTSTVTVTSLCLITLLTMSLSS